MPPTPESEHMKAVVASVAPLMKEQGFRKRRHGFNRPTSGGLVHVLDFQMGAYQPMPPSLTSEEREKYIETKTRILGFFSNYGSFTVNVGVYIPELEELMFGIEGKSPPSSGFIPEYRCHIRQRLGEMAYGSDTWWRLDLPASEVGPLMTELIQRHAVPFLNRFPDRDAIFARWEADPNSVPGLGPGRLAIIAAHRGDHSVAKGLLQAQYDEVIHGSQLPGQRRYVERVAEYLGYPLNGLPAP